MFFSFLGAWLCYGLVVFVLHMIITGEVPERLRIFFRVVIWLGLVLTTLIVLYFGYLFNVTKNYHSAPIDFSVRPLDN